MTAEVDRPEAASSGSSSPVPGAGAAVPAVDAPPETQAVCNVFGSGILVAIPCRSPVGE